MVIREASAPLVGEVSLEIRLQLIDGRIGSVRQSCAGGPSTSQRRSCGASPCPLW